jgi:hypothetical protein
LRVAGVGYPTPCAAGGQRISDIDGGVISDTERISDIDGGAISDTERISDIDGGAIARRLAISRGGCRYQLTGG